jgi:hypothetical protein
VAVYRLLQNSAFGPEEVSRMTTDEDVLRALGLANRADPITEIVAKKIIEIAQPGERDPHHTRMNSLGECTASKYAVALMAIETRRLW